MATYDTSNPIPATSIRSPSTATTAERNLRIALRVNAASSGTFGAIGAIGASYWSERLGIDHVAITVAISIGLLLFAADVARTSFLDVDRLRTQALLVSIADISWVAASIVVVALGILTTFGTVAALAVAVMVADFAAAQLWFRRQL